MEPDPFPIGRPITPEERQIGRRQLIDSLEDDIVQRCCRATSSQARRYIRQDFRWRISRKR
jgi:hypothetical protein